MKMKMDELKSLIKRVVKESVADHLTNDFYESREELLHRCGQEAWDAWVRHEKAAGRPDSPESTIFTFDDEGAFAEPYELSGCSDDEAKVFWYDVDWGEWIES